MSRNSRGFTLIEILLTMLITAIIVMLVHGVLVSTLQASHQVDEIIEGGEIGPAILQIVRQDLEAALIPDEKQECFVGTDARLDFITSNFTLVQEEEEDEQPVFYSINETGFQLKPTDGNSGYQTLYRRHQPSIDTEPAKGGALIELYERVRSIAWEYYDGKDWQKEWNNVKNKGFPEAIRLTLVIGTRSVNEGGEEDEATYKTLITFPDFPDPTN